MILAEKSLWVNSLPNKSDIVGLSCVGIRTKTKLKAKTWTKCPNEEQDFVSSCPLKGSFDFTAQWSLIGQF